MYARETVRPALVPFAAWRERRGKIRWAALFVWIAAIIFGIGIWAIIARKLMNSLVLL